MRAINTGTSSTLVQITRTGVASFVFAANSKLSNVNIVTPWGPPSAVENRVVFSPIAESELYQTYSKIFDQVRLERMEVSLAPTQSLTSGSNTLVLYSAVDRNFTSTELGQTVAQLTQASGVVVKNIQPATTSPFRRVVYPKDLQEKTTYIDSHYTIAAASGKKLTAWMNAQGNFVAFSPAVSFGLLSTVAPSAKTNLTFIMTVKYYVRFRGAKTEIVSANDPILDIEPDE